MTKIRSMTIRQEGKIEPVENLDRETSDLQGALDRWKHLREEVKGKRWGQCPPEMVADFVKSISYDVLREYGHNSLSKMAISAAVARSRIDPDKLDMRLSCQTADGVGSIDVVFSTTPKIMEDDTGEFTAVEVEADMSRADFESITEGQSTSDVLKTVMKSDGTEREREIFDPLYGDNLPDSEIMRLVQDIEKQLPIVDSNREENEFDVLFTACGVLLMWKNAESVNASNSTFSLGGLHEGERYIYPGMTVKVECDTRIYDNTPAPESSEEMVSANISVIKPRKPR